MQKYLIENHPCKPWNLGSSAKWCITALGLGLSLACGGGGGASSTSTTSPTADTSTTLNKFETGVFLDSAVSGLYYKTDSLEGTTDSLGRFSYVSGENVTFYIGATPIGTSTGNSTITPAELMNTTADSGDRRLTNALRLLQSLDDDGDPDNGIQIPESFQRLTERLEIKFDQDPNTFDFSDNLQKMLSISPRALIKAADALNHFQKTLIRKNSPGGDELKRPLEYDSPEDMLTALDLDNNGELNREEFVTPASDNLILRWNSHFESLDTDTSGDLSLAEWENKPQSRKSKAEQTPQEIFNTMDADSNEEISLSEWTTHRNTRYNDHKNTIFNKKDRDSSDSLSLEELQFQFQKDDSERQKDLVERLDLNDDDVISPEEFLQEVPEEKLEQATAAFERMDSDGDDFLSSEEIRPNPRKDAKERRAQHFAELDQNGDGLLSLEEYISQAPEELKERASAHFLKMDLDQSGDLSIDELKGKKRR
jgi:Ca2+-binding EF-hand superfamily protein